MKNLLNLIAAGVLLVSPAVAAGQAATNPTQGPPAAAQPSNGSPAVPAGVPLPAGYVIGPEDVLTVVFWRDKDMTTDVAVRPDGRITLPLIHDVQAAGLTPEELRDHITTAATKYLDDPNVTVVVKAINSRKVFITGMVGKGGPYALTAPTTVLQLISMAGGVHEFAKTKDIIIVRNESGKQAVFKFNYDDVKKGKNLKQNIELKPGDTVIVPE